MIVTVSARHMDISPAFRTHAESKVAKFDKYNDRIQEIEVVLDAGKGVISIELIVNAEQKKMFIANHTDADAYACLDHCVHKIERQLVDFKKKVKNHKHPEEG